MSASYDLFCRWKHVQKIQSDNAGALALGVSRATVSLWKQGKNAEIHYIERMAVDIGDSPEMWSAVVMAERSNSEDEKAAWRRIAQKLATVVMALCLFVGAALPHDVQAMPQAGNALHDIHYAKCCIGLWRRSCPRRGNGWVSGSALACALSPRPRMRSRHD
ncbi:DUF3693 domain-containing protein [Stenotrophomonas sp. Sm3147]|uniref:DUF3693 domain-containing protein n=1 Tax=Stenotrophomonas sp. Sm3147 TaxID=3002746 RepID=UPI0027E46424|nr:DUF3693 domain-containing protein [Stenotrophomonas sp. Sm3147]MDQ7276893.1 DUF3693 domain-containing protein [Stenotrophomonas sp. Sm3147]